MSAWRSLLRTRPHLAMLAIVAALLMKALLPGGTMVAATGTVLTVTICADASGAAAQTRQIVLPHEDAGTGKAAQDDSAGAPCTFGALSMASLAAADPVLLAAALAFVVALGLAAMPRLLLARPPRLHPPLRGPPQLA